MTRDSFIFYRSFYDSLTVQPEKVRREGLEAIVAYALNGTEPGRLSPGAATAFISARPLIDANNLRFEGGRKGGRPKKMEEDEDKNHRFSEIETIGFENGKPYKDVYKDVDLDKDEDEDGEGGGILPLSLPPAEPCGPIDSQAIAPVPHRKFFDLWNEICAPAGMPRATVLSEGRKNKIRARCSEWGPDPAAALDRAREIFSRMAASDFLRGRKPGCDFRADFAWITDSPNNWVKVMEGRYDNHEAARPRSRADEVLENNLRVQAEINARYGLTADGGPIDERKMIER